MPERIQRRRKRGWRMPEGAVYVGRPSRYGNPYVPRRRSRDGVYFWVSEPLTRPLSLVAHHRTEWDAIRECVERFCAEVARPSWAERIAELRGKDLMCWCPPGQACHADVLLEIANSKEQR